MTEAATQAALQQGRLRMALGRHRKECMSALRTNGDGTIEPLPVTLLKAAATAAVIAMVPIGLSLNSSLERNCRASEQALATAQAVVKVDNELARPAHRDTRQLLLHGQEFSC